MRKMRVIEPVRTINARSGKISWNWTRVEPAHISYLLGKGEVLLNTLTRTKAASVVEYIATRESIRKCANVCRTLSDEKIEILTNYAALNADESSYLRVLTFMLKEGLYDNCVLYLPMTRNLRAGINDTDTEVYDRSPFGNHGTIHGAVWQTLPSGKSVLSFDGVDDYVEVSNSESLKFTNKDEITIAVWVYLKNLTGDHQFIVSKGVAPGYWLYWKNDENLWRSLITDGTNYLYASYYDPNPLNKWVQLVGVYSNNTMMLYVNSEKKDEDTKTLADFTLTENLLIGKNPYDTYYFNGIIEVRIYNIALSPEAIKRLFNLTRVFYGV